MEGSTISHFRVVRRIACGGMGVVYEAEDLRLGRKVALKFLPDEFAADADAMERFHREARAASSLNHPNICTIYEIGAEAGKTFIAMELIAGHTLADTMAGHRPELRRVLDWSVQITDGLAAVHGRSLIHRDLKPANIFITTTNLAKLLDFGLAKNLPREAGSDSLTLGSSITADHAAVGTLMYMSPEQSLGKPVDCRTDIFSFGVVLYLMCTGTLPFRGDTSPAVFDAILHAQPTSPVRLNPDLPDSLERVISRCLEKDPQLRFQTASDLNAELQRIRRDLFSTVTASSPAAATSTRTIAVPRLRLRHFVALAIVLLLAAGGWWAIHRATFGAAPADRTIAVLPFTSSDNDADTNFLRIAVPDDIVTALSRMRTLSVRPFSQTMSATNNADVTATAKRLGVQSVLTGYFLRRGSQVHLAMEVAGADGRLQWRDAIDGNVDDVLAMQEKAKQRIFDFLSERYGLTAETGPGAAPSSKKAFDLYMKAAAVPWQPAHNAAAVALLQQAVSLDPQYAPAWHALGLRYSFDAGVGLAACPCEPGFGDDTAREQAKSALERAASLDPLLVDPVAALVVFEASEGKTAQAYDRASWIVSRRSDSVQARLSLAYVYRFAGLLDKSAQQCEQAYALDPNSSLLRSCAFTFMELGRYDQALRFVAVDGDSEWAARARADILLRKGQDPRVVVAALPQGSSADLLRACFEGKPGEEVRKLGLAAESNMPPGSDAEAAYYVGAYEAACAQNAPAIRLLKRAISGGYCSVPAVATDPLFAKLRSDPLYPSVERDATQCQKDFLAHAAAR